MKKAFLTLAVGAWVSASTCWAQPAVDAGKAQNPVPAEAQKEALDKAMAQGLKQAEVAIAMNPARRREWLEKMMEEQLFSLMQASGVGDLEVQERLGLFLKAENAARMKLRESSANLRDAIADKTSTPAQIAALIAQSTAEAQAERTRKAKADSDLSEELDLANAPRLEGFLRLYGVIGDGAWLTGGLISGMGLMAMLPEPAEMPKP